MGHTQPIDHLSSFSGSVHGQGQIHIPYSTNQGKNLKVILLHGNLNICVKQAVNLPNMDALTKSFGQMFSKLTNKIESKITTSDPYVTVSVSGAVVARTFVIENSENPVWNQQFEVPVAHSASEIHFIVKDNDVVGSEVIGIVGLPVEELVLKERIEGWFPILGANGSPCNGGAGLSLSIQFKPMESGASTDGVPGTYFPLRKGGKVTLYQDAHVEDGHQIGSFDYERRSCWTDVFRVISEARRLVYITGWSVNYNVRLVRDGGRMDCTLGELLKAKSQEGVRVLLLVWDDPTSGSILGHNHDGIMGTGDEETRRYFKNSSVQVLLCPRSPDQGHSFIKNQEVGTIYTHHQKTVIADADAGRNRRKIVAFVGGLDLCNGRYDTQEHSLFRTSQTVHKDDFHNPTFSVPNAGGCPREPWHDLHSKIEGPAAYDVLTNFEERWSKASKPRGIHKLTSSLDDALLKLERIPEILGISEAASLADKDPEAWHVQVFRSIDSTSVKGFPEDPRHATSKNLHCGKNILIDMSIHAAYVKAIRSAKHFIYIENQYFIGSSYAWDSYNNLGANNLIPMEIALKIVTKIRANERFAAYILVPMWPEGVPTGAATQRILFWQQKTMQMMYETIYKALVEVGLDKTYEPQDYLNFFCLGNREEASTLDREVAAYPETAATNTPQALSQKNRRFMIYVHSKGMIVDDEYVIIGSANINQRSMEGTRDSEIAMGAFQPRHTLGNAKRPHGQVHGYRNSLWEEHIGFIEDCFERPESVECVRRVRMIGEENWKEFAGETVTEMKGHLLKYPVEVDRTGKIGPLPGCSSFPDVGGNILGSYIPMQKNLNICGSSIAIQENVNAFGSFLPIQENLTI
ncbi:Phospholipase D beta 1 [Linum perenne]